MVVKTARAFGAIGAIMSQSRVVVGAIEGNHEVVRGNRRTTPTGKSCVNNIYCSIG